MGLQVMPATLDTAVRAGELGPLFLATLKVTFATPCALHTAGGAALMVMTGPCTTLVVKAMLRLKDWLHPDEITTAVKVT